ncbi:MAG: tripartite tricarboxylate transporter permease [Kiritimatiellae bacterium]|nr:tripartite tricarboxylate transporter permease [Kiritimatiellia bacterium]
MLVILATSVLVTLISAFVSIIPAFHIYNQLAIVTACFYFLPLPDFLINPEIKVTIFSTLLVGYIYFANIPSVLFAAPDDSTFFATPISSKFLDKGNALSAIMISAFGSALSLFVLLLLLPFLGNSISIINETLRPHFSWILWCIIVYIVLSEWPKVYSQDQGGVRYLLHAWRTCFGGLLTICLSGALGFLVLRTGVLRTELSFIKLMPAFIGLFTIPGMLHNIYVNYKLPSQKSTIDVLPTAKEFACGFLPGVSGGAFAALIPGVTAGVAGMISGQSSNLTDEKSILVSQGASRMVYYVGAVLLFFPLISGISRGGMAQLLKINDVTQASHRNYYAAGAAMLVGSALAILLLPVVFRIAVKFISKFGTKYISMGLIALIVILITCCFRFNGLIVLLTTTAIGTLPNHFGCRRINCLGIILIPLAIVL